MILTILKTFVKIVALTFVASVIIFYLYLVIDYLYWDTKPGEMLQGLIARKRCRREHDEIAKTIPDRKLPDKEKLTGMLVALQDFGAKYWEKTVGEIYAEEHGAPPTLDDIFEVSDVPDHAQEEINRRRVIVYNNGNFCILAPNLDQNDMFYLEEDEFDKVCSQPVFTMKGWKIEVRNFTKDDAHFDPYGEICYDAVVPDINAAVSEAERLGFVLSEKQKEQ